jgi:hypothetical protein
MTYPKSGLIAKVFCLAALLLPTFLPAQITFKHTYGGALDDEGRSVQQTADGGYIIAGYTCSYGSGREDVYLVKADSEGNEEWSRVYGGANYDEGWSVRQTADGGYVIAGQTESFGAGFTDLYLVRTDPYGETLWTRTYGGTSDDYGYSVELANEGGFVIAGSTKAYGAADHDVWLVRVNADGDTLWTRTYGISRWEKGYSVDRTADGGFIVTGYAFMYGGAWLLKFNADGDTMWTRAFSDSGRAEGYSVQQTRDGGYIIAGFTETSVPNHNDVYLVKTDSLGRTAVEEPRTSATRAAALSLSCAPNPCRGATRISFKPQASSLKPATLRIYDAQGRLQSTFDIRASSFRLDLGSMPAGVYLARLDCGSQHASTRLVLER